MKKPYRDEWVSVQVLFTRRFANNDEIKIIIINSVLLSDFRRAECTTYSEDALDNAIAIRPMLNSDFTRSFCSMQFNTFSDLRD